MRRAQNTDTHAHKQHRLSQNIFLSAPVLYWLSHLTCISSLKAKNAHFHTTKNIQIQSTFFSLFLDEFLENDLRPIYCSRTCDRLRGIKKKFVNRWRHQPAFVAVYVVSVVRLWQPQLKPMSFFGNL